MVPQFVNHKTNRLVQFEYSEFEADGRTLAVIRIPTQRRPFFLLKPYGRLQAQVVYVRRGTSTDLADPDEIFKMGEALVPAKDTPQIEVQFADLADRKQLGAEVKIDGLFLEPLSNGELPEVGEHNPMGASLRFGGLNRQYYRELREYVWARNAVRGFGFVARNTSHTVALGAKATFTLPYTDDIVLLRRLPRRPKYHYELAHLMQSPPPVVDVNPDVWFDRHGAEWHLHINFDKVRPGANTWTVSRLYIGTRTARTVIPSGELFDDNFDPVPLELRVVSAATRRQMTREDLHLDDAGPLEGTDNPRRGAVGYTEEEDG
jgi:hypothetical protein